MPRDNEKHGGITAERETIKKLVGMRRKLGVDSNPQFLKILADNEDVLLPHLRKALKSKGFFEGTNPANFDWLNYRHVSEGVVSAFV